MGGGIKDFYSAFDVNLYFIKFLNKHSLFYESGKNIFELIINILLISHLFEVNYLKNGEKKRTRAHSEQPFHLSNHQSYKTLYVSVSLFG